jgi:metallopeptidase MepB
MSDPLNPAAGRRYRELVLEPGAGVSEAGTLRGFLGRNPSSEAYYAELARGIE